MSRKLLQRPTLESQPIPDGVEIVVKKRKSRREKAVLDFPRPDSRSLDREPEISQLGRVRAPTPQRASIAHISRAQVLNQCYLLREQLAQTMASLGVPPAGTDYEDLRAMIAFSYPVEEYSREISLVSSRDGESVTVKFTRRKA